MTGEEGEQGSFGSAASAAASAPPLLASRCWGSGGRLLTTHGQRLIQQLFELPQTARNCLTQC
eukprot:4465410-Alexandrium_andersonii.AAC.1